MLIYITDKREIREITLRTWDNKVNNGWSPDCFGDLAADLPIDHPSVHADCAASMTEKDFLETVEWWETETRGYNERTACNWFVEALDEDERAGEYAKDIEYICSWEIVRKLGAFDAESIAAALYDGGWRAEDKDDIIIEYELTEGEADTVCNLLSEYAERGKGGI